MNREEFKSRRPRVIEITLDDGSRVHAKKLSQAQRETVNRLYTAPGKGQEGYRYIVMKCLCDPEGTRIFQDDDFKALEEVPGDDIERIAQEVVFNLQSKTDANGASPNA